MKNTKVCSKCGIEKELHHFAKNSSHKDGLKSQCNECRNKYYLLHKQEINGKCKRYYETHKEQFRIHNKKYKNENRNKINIIKRAYYKKYPEKHVNYYNKNKKSINKKIRIRLQNKPSLRIIKNLRSRINKVLKGINKSESTIKLIDCSIDFLKNYLESQFTEGMNWENYGVGGWEVDHIKPCSRFDLTKPKEQQICFHYTNLQPLWFKENRSKQDKIL